MADRDRRVRVHYEGNLCIRHRGQLTIIATLGYSLPVCMTTARVDVMITREVSEVTCKRCKSLIEQAE